MYANAEMKGRWQQNAYSHQTNTLSHAYTSVSCDRES